MVNAATKQAKVTCAESRLKHAGSNRASLLSVLLKRMSGWMATAAGYLQRCHQATQQGSAGTAYMEGLDPSQHLNSIAQARQALQVPYWHKIIPHNYIVSAPAGCN